MEEKFEIIPGTGTKDHPGCEKRNRNGILGLLDVGDRGPRTARCA